MKGRLKGAWILSLLLAGLFQPNLGQEHQKILTGLHIPHQHEDTKSCLHVPLPRPTQDPAKVECYDSIQGTIYDYGALTITDEYIPFRNYMGKFVLFVNVATY